MGFMNAYKQLDNLCRDINGIGVSGYISDMDEKHDGSFKVRNWSDDYRNLKHYRHIRNQIAHEAYVDEFNMCNAADVAWVEGFYRRIITQTDPLSIYRKATAQANARKKPAITAKVQDVRISPDTTNNSSSSEHNLGRRVAVIIVSAVIIALVVLSLTLLYALYN